MTLIVILSILTAVALCFLICGKIENNFDAIGGSLFSLILIGVLGWGLIGTLYENEVKTGECPATVLHDAGSVHLSVKGIIIKSYTDIATITYLTDKETANVTWTQRFNIYKGNCRNIEWALSNKQ